MTKTKLPASLAAEGIVPYEEPDFYRLIMYSHGRDASGKTDFALSAPGPIVIFNNDKELGDMPRRRFKGKVIAEVPYFIPPDLKMNDTKLVAAAMKEIIVKFKKQFRAFVKDPDIRTIVLDNGTVHWRMVRLALFGTVKPGVSSLSYDVANAEMDMLFNYIRQCRKNFIVINQSGKVYSKGKSRTGKDVSEWDGKSWECQGYSNISYAPTVGLYHYKDGDGDMNARIIKCSPNRDLEQYPPLSGDDLSFAALGKLIFPESPDSAWE